MKKEKKMMNLYHFTNTEMGFCHAPIATVIGGTVAIEVFATVIGGTVAIGIPIATV